MLISSVGGVAAAEPVTAPVDVPAPAELVSLVYSGAAAGCPSETEFVSEIMARVTRPVRFGAGGAAVQMVVTLFPNGEQVTGKLEVSRATSEPTHRDFTASSCEEVGSALALVAALSLDPNARTDALPVRAVGTQGAAAAPVAEAPASPVAPPPKAPAPTTAAPASPPLNDTRYGYWVGMAGSGVLGAAPKPLGLVGLSAGLRGVRERLLSPSLQLTAAWGKTGVTGPAGSPGEFTWALGRLELCPLSVSLSEPLRLDPCAALEVGRLTARGADTSVVPVTAERWWVAPGATVSLHAHFDSWFVRAGASALFPATRDEFVFREPNRSVHQASPVVVGVSLALGIQFGE
ncbi:MAG TPA: hypothetical protein VHB79_05100 [Polyangiaceae bacterium]|nr:hypothetical protein [Polyangiaceae bacterium]